MQVVPKNAHRAKELAGPGPVGNHPHWRLEEAPAAAPKVGRPDTFSVVRISSLARAPHRA
jgi:hypothetical protein